MVWVRFKDTGTHKGELSINMPSIGKVTIAPTGKKVTFTAVGVWHIVKGKIAEKVSGIYDMLDFYKELGIIEYKAPK
ncbi:MAG: ester cyclase [Candidatus Bathyarchaeota archaeon]